MYLPQQQSSNKNSDNKNQIYLTQVVVRNIVNFKQYLQKYKQLEAILNPTTYSTRSNGDGEEWTATTQLNKGKS